MLLSLMLGTMLLAGEEAPPHRVSFAPFVSDRLEDCLQDVQRTPRALLPYARLMNLALLPASRAEALATLERLAATRNTGSRAQLYLGITRFKLSQRGEAEKLLRAAVERLRAEDEEVGETYGRLYLELILRLDGRMPDASRELERAQQLAARLADPILSAQVQVFEGWEAFSAGDFGRALTLFESSRDVLVGGPNGYVESLAWEGIASTDVQLYRHREAVEAEVARIHAVERDGAPTSGPRAALANRAFYMADEGGVPWSDVDRLIAEALEDATRTESPTALHAAMYLRALRLGVTEEGERMLEELRAAHQASHDRYAWIAATWELGRLRGRLHPDRRLQAEQLLTQAYEAAAESHLPGQMSVALESRALLRWERGDEEGARADTGAALRLQEWERDRQYEESARIGSGSRSFMAYVDLAGPFLARGDGPEAFDIIERMRARSLLDSVRQGRAPVEPKLRERRAVLRARLVALQSELLSPELTPPLRVERRRELAQAELEERRLDDDIAHASGPSHGSITPLHLDEVQRRLAPDEALLSFVVAPEGHADRGDFLLGPRSFLQLVTSREVRQVRIPDRDTLTGELGMFLAGVESRTGLEGAGAAELYRQLLGDAVDGLAPGVRRLILLPSGPLHGLPFELLRATPEGQSLGERFALVRAPSATVWVSLRERSGSGEREPLMALADPGTLSPSAPAVRRAAPWIEGIQLGALPHARAEAEDAVEALGPGSRLLVGPDASEHALKTLPLKRWAVLHLAAHAVVDDESPERSAVVLTPGSPEEDGLLQSRDIADLDLDGMLVVLAACRTASGRPSSAEGPVGLTRAFLQAGARAVVVSLWELEDAASQRLFDHFYQRLAEGDSVQEALRSARAARIEAGAASADWAGLVVVGDGDFRLSQTRWNRRRLIAAATAAALVLLLGLAARRRRLAPRSPRAT